MEIDFQFDTFKKIYSQKSDYLNLAKSLNMSQINYISHLMPEVYLP